MQPFEENLPNNQVIINLAAIESNIKMMRLKIGNAVRIMVMVKARAYGTDDILIAKFLHTCGIDIVGVAYVDEGVSIRQAGVTQAIFVLNAASYEAVKAVTWDLEVGVSNSQLIDALQREAEKQQKKTRVHLHIDTGMCRFGCRYDEILPLAQKIVSSPNLIFEGIMTHFAAADMPAEDHFSQTQAALFQRSIELLEQESMCPRWRHAANSSAAIRFTFPFCNMVRLGLAVYGLHTSSATVPLIPLQPAISLISRIVGINKCQKGNTISYGRSYQVPQKACIAVLPIGYYDGLHRHYSGKSYVIIRGKKAPMVGRICMDYMMVDITDIPQAQIGDQALIFGENKNGEYVSPEEFATAGGSIVHELLTCLGPRIQRLFIYDHDNA